MSASYEKILTTRSTTVILRRRCPTRYRYRALSTVSVEVEAHAMVPSIAASHCATGSRRTFASGTAASAPPTGSSRPQALSADQVQLANQAQVFYFDAAFSWNPSPVFLMVLSRFRAR